MDWRALPPLSALRAFAALSQTGSFSRAGIELNVSHAAISQQVRGLEERLGTALARREGRGIALTPQGEQLAATLTPAFAAISRAVDELSDADATRPLQVSMTPSFAVGWLMPRISEFHHLHPKIELMLNPSAELVDLAPGGVDMAIRYGGGGWAGLRTELLLPCDLVFVAARSLIGDRAITSPGDILDFPWLQELGTNEMSLWLRERGVFSPNRSNVTHLPGHLVLEGLRRGQGVTATSRLFVGQDVAEGRLVILFEDDRPDTGYYLVTHPGVMRPPLKAFVSWLRRHAIPPDTDPDADKQPQSPPH